MGRLTVTERGTDVTPAASGMRSARQVDIVEGTAMTASFLCLLHCVALPLLLMLLPGVFGLIFRSDMFHYLALGLVLPSAAAAFGLGYLRHHAIAPPFFGLVGVGCLAVALIPGALESIEAPMTIAGSIFLLVGHMMNWRLRRRI